MAWWGQRPASIARSLLLAAAVLACARPAVAGEISLKTENYLFAASEALDDGDPALALSLLRRAKAEDPDCCILDEFLCRTHIELGQLDRATDSYGDFVGCMESSDEPVRQELEGLLAEAKRNPAPTDPDPDGSTPGAGDPSAVTRGGARDGGGGRPGLVMAGVGGGVAAGFGVTATVIFVQSRVWIEQGDRETYEARKPLNNTSAVIAAAGGGIALVGLIIDMATARQRAGTATTGDRIPAIAPGPGQVGLSASWRF
jgi:hypothetical protein